MKKLLIVSQVWPEPASSAAGSRMIQLLHLFLQNDYEICFSATGMENEFSSDLDHLNIRKESIVPNHGGFDEFLKNENPDVVIFDRFMTEEQFGWRVAEICPDAVRVLDTEDLHFLRKARQQALLEKRDFQEKDLYSDAAKREIASILRCDLTLIISEVEMELLKTNFKIDENLLLYLPFLLKKMTAPEIEDLPGFEERKHFVSIGNFRHPPNLDMLFYIKEKIWPLIRKGLPEAEIYIYGAYPPKKVMDLHSPETGFLVMGRADDSKKAISKAKILLAPLRFGAGLKGKMVEAMQCGTVCVTTPIGVEGISGELPFCGKTADSPHEIAQAAMDLYQNKTEWKRAQQAGFEIINKRFQIESFEEAFLSKLKYIQSNLRGCRQENFIGSLLMYHSMQGTKYMAKWIEAKNILKEKM